MRLNKSKETLTERIAELKALVKAGKEAAVNIPKLESYIERIQDRISALDYDGKRLVLDMLGITIWLDGDTAEITGTIAPESIVTVSVPMKEHIHSNILPFKLKIRVTA